jgi:hypothetical protein
MTVIVMMMTVIIVMDVRMGSVKSTTFSVDVFLDNTHDVIMQILASWTTNA